MKKITITIAVLIVLALAAYFYITARDKSSLPVGDNGGGNAIACTMDAKECPDGTWVGRTGPNCEFVCPSGTSTK